MGRITPCALLLAVLGLPVSTATAQVGFGEMLGIRSSSTRAHRAIVYASDEEGFVPTTRNTTAQVSPVSATALAFEEGCDDFCESRCEEYTTMVCDNCCSDPWLSVRGWLAQGITGNPDNPGNRFNTPVTFNDRANEYQMNQLYLILEHEIDPDSCSWQIGGRADVLYGTDYFFTTAKGLETRQDGSPRWNSGIGPRGSGAALYGLALPQLYAEVFVPVAGGVRVKLGHFYTILGYESVMAPENFFYSHSYSMQYGEPFTHTGALASAEIGNGVTIQGGFTRGWDTWEDPTDTYGFLGGVSWTSCDERTSVAFSLHTGKEGAVQNLNQRTTYSMVFSHEINPCVTYILQHDLGIEENGSQSGDAEWYSINQYLLCALSETVDVGLRYEWFRDDDNARVLAIPTNQVQGGNYHEATIGLNWKPCENIVLRPEARWDWSDVNAPGLGLGGMFNEFSQKNQFTFGTDLIISY